MKDNKRHVIARTEHGTSEWMLPGTMNEPPEVIESGELPAIEEMIVAQGWKDIMVAMERGTFSWVAS